MRAPRSPTAKWSRFDLEVPEPGRIEYPLHVGVWDPAPAGRLTMDIHQGMEIGLVLRGRVERHFEDVVYVAGPGDLHLCSAWEPHGWRVLTPRASQVVFIFLAEVIDESAFREIPWLSFFTLPPAHRPQATSREMREVILALGRRVHYEGREQPRGWQAACCLLLHELLLTLHRYWEPPKGALPLPHVSAGSFGRLMPAVGLVHAGPARVVSTDEAAAACGLRRAQFNALFRQTMGVSFQDFRRRARLASGAHLLLTTDLSTDALAEATGFVDGSHFHRTFAKYYGLTPGQYRAAHRG